MSAAAPTYCTRKEIHACCTLQRQCSARSGTCHGLCSGFPLNKKGTRMILQCAAHAAGSAASNLINNPINNAATSERKRELSHAASLLDAASLLALSVAQGHRTLHG